MKPKLKITGDKELLKKIRAFGEEAETRIEGITQIAAQEIALKAIQNVPVNYGKIKQSISSQKESKLLYTVNVNELPIGAYVEFGTGAKVQVPDEWKDLAWQFYVNGQGYLPPTPFLYPAWKAGGKQYEKDLKDLLERLTDKYNK